MASSGGTSGPPSDATGEGDSKAPPAPTDSSLNTGKSSPTADSGSGNNNNNKDGGGNVSGDNNNNGSPQSSSSPPPASPPPSPSSPPPASPPPSKEGGSENTPPSEKSPPPKASPPPFSPPPSLSSSPPPSSPPLSSSSPSQSSPPPGSPPPNSPGQSSPPPPGQSFPPTSPGQSSRPPSPGQSSPASNPPATNGNADSGGSKWSPPSQPDSPPSPASSTAGGTSPLNSNTQANSSSNVLSPPPYSTSSPSRESPHDSSPASNSLSSGKTRTTSSGSSSPSTTESTDSGTIIGATAAAIFVLALIAIFFVLRGRRKKRDAYANHYIPPPNNYNEKTDGYYYGQNYPMKYSGPVDTYYGSQTQPSPLTNSYGSQRANGYHGGSGGPDSGVLGGCKSFFTYEELMEITNGFSRENVIGEGGFGCVYKGSLPDRRVVAVKQLKAGSGQGEREFRAEVEIISRVHHRHLVSLVGYCISENNRLLIYEFVPNNNLEHHLHGEGMPVLDWSKRVKVALGSAKGLAYLHEDCHPKIIHRDIKSANILIDDAFEAQVADFGLAKLNDTTQTHVSTRVMGTFGYLAPEYASSGKLTDRSDVFSFGVVLLELITGRKPVDASQPLGDESLVEWARPHLVHALETGDVSELVDTGLEKHYVESEMFRMIEAAAACIRHSAPKRPRMVQVVRVLDSEGGMSDLSNGVKYGQSTIYDSGQYNQDILMFRKMALGFGDSSELSGEYTSTDAFGRYSGSLRSQETSRESISGESGTSAINQNSSEQRYSGNQGRGGRF